MSLSDVVIVSAKRTPIGAFQGSLASLTAPQLGGNILSATLDACGMAASDIDEVLMGCVLQAGVGQNPARQAALNAGFPVHVGATTVNKVCGSGMKAVMLASDLIRCQEAAVIAAGGMESMSNAPYLLSKARSGLRFGHSALKDAMLVDGLEEASDGTGMGVYAERTAARFQFSRETQDAYAIQTTQKALQALEQGWFKAETVPLETKAGMITMDETPERVNLKKIPLLKPAFQKDGTVTAASSSSLSDGAAALLLMSEQEARRRGLTVRAYIRGHATHSQEPAWFTCAPIDAVKKLIDKVDWKTSDVDLFEINEAFAVVALAAIKELNLDPFKVNVHGGACALGHPIGASGSRLLVTLLHALEIHDLKRGIASLCIGGGEATALALERP